MRRGESGISCLLAIDKPEGLSSHDVVGRVRRALGERRVGHAGTLDPAATGVLVVGVGLATRLLGLLTLDDKRYVARVVFGSQTTTDDAEGEVVRTAPVPPELREADFATSALRALEGPCSQVPPAFSAISVDGRRAYDRARSGEQVELAARDITIYEAQLLALEDADPLCWTCAFHVSKGTYIRSIARDLGEQLGTAAHLGGLRRTASGPVGLGACMTLDELGKSDPSQVLQHALDPVRALQLPVLQLTDSELADVQVGKRLPTRSVEAQDGSTRIPVRGERVALVHGSLLMGVWECKGSVLASVANFPAGITGVGA